MIHKMRLSERTAFFYGFCYIPKHHLQAVLKSYKKQHESHKTPLPFYYDFYNYNNLKIASWKMKKE